jgi:hypothetical protein
MDPSKIEMDENKNEIYEFRKYKFGKKRRILDKPP